MTGHVQQRLDVLIRQTVEALGYSAEDHVRHYVADLGHRDFAGMKIVFDLRVDDYASMNRHILEEVIKAEMSKDFQDRVTVISE